MLRLSGIDFTVAYTDYKRKQILRYKAIPDAVNGSNCRKTIISKYKGVIFDF